MALAPTVPYYAIALSGDPGGISLDGTNIVFQADRPRAIAVSVRELTIPGVLGTTDLAWRTDGEAVWFPEADESADGLDAAQSGALGAKGASWLETTVIGPGTMSFQWKFVPGSVNSGIDLLIDGDYEDGLTDATDGWESYSLDIGSGRHVVRWEFYGSDGDNGTAWLDQVEWNGGYPEPTYTAIHVTGPGTADFTGGLLEDGSNMVVRITPEVNYYRISMSGDTNGVTLDGTTLSFVVTGPRTINVLIEELTLENALDSTGVVWRTGENAVWFPECDTASDGIDAAQSGVVTNKGASWIETTVMGSGMMTFRWKLATNGTRSGIDLLIDEDYEDGLDSDTDWIEYELAVESGSHVIRWEFWNQDSQTGCEAYLDLVSWTPDVPATTETQTTSEPVPYAWLRSFYPDLADEYDAYESAALAMAANGVNKVWECYVAGISPTNAAERFEATIEIGADGKPVVRWNPSLAPEEEAKRTRKVLGKKALDPAENWTDVTDAADADAEGYRFFKVKVEMK